ncbi:histidine kinase dimerization/phosphoacceptor domain -containing protein [Chitinophaga sp. S165]|uniref:tetratricopeptide repeat-containing sensor histidine kinase n=1 Tax=Chitinophaga sp. S165 TaxID=2135462 RepID=UPI000D71150C|nr:histidine kinase dimerization/phosphoacceptor domain -containing protein [Chitinophaga sp. S165]PWV45412.1 two-component sensor histidine kinase [Chitinophaga sp. S165]
MNRLLLFSCCMIGYLFPCLAQSQLPSHSVLQQLVKKERPDTAEIHILLNAGYVYVMRPGTTRTDMDSAALYAEKALRSAVKADEEMWEGRSCLLYAQIFREQNLPAKGIEYGLRAKDLFEKLDRKDYLADTYTELAGCYDINTGDGINTRIKYYKEAARLYGEAGLKERQAHTLYVLGDHYNVLDDYKSLTEALIQSVAIYDEIKVEPGADIYSLLGLGYNRQGDFGNALKYSVLAVKVIESLKDTIPAHIAVYNRLGLLYYYMGEHKDALKYYEKAWPIAIKLKDTTSLWTLSVSRAACYAKISMYNEAISVLKREERYYPPVDPRDKIQMYLILARCYLDTNRPNEFLTYLHQLDNNRKYVPEELQAAVDDLGARYNFYLKRYAKSHELASQMLANASKMNSSNAQQQAYFNLYKADSAMGNFEEALTHYRMYKSINDTLFNTAKSRQISVLQVQFETKQKDQALQLNQQNIELLTRKAELQNAALNTATFTRNVIIAGAAMLAIMLGLVYNRYQLKLRSNRQLEHKQDEINQKNKFLQKLVGEKEWLVKEIHHRVKNNLQIVMSLLNTQAAFLDDKDALNAIRESRYRMQAISLIHQKLYQSENMALIDMHTYIRDLVEYLKDGFSDISRIRFDLQISHVKLDVSQSVPIGLILNEAITNAIKYAFTGNNNGIITISLQETIPGQLSLRIADNGAGIPPEDNKPRKQSMGMMLMDTLAEQLDGTLNIQSRNGVIITVSFKYQEKQTFTEPEELEEEMAGHV